jgi:hypothetical protein
MKKRFRIGKLLFLSAAPDGDVVSIYRNVSKCRHCRDTLRDGSKREPRLRCVVRPEREQTLLLQRF